MKRATSILLTSFYALLFVFFFMLFIEESPFGKKSHIIRFREVFSVGWNFFTQDPRNYRTQIFFYRNNQWVEMGKSGEVKEQITRITDAMQLDIYNFTTPEPDSSWKAYPSITACFQDTAALNPGRNFHQAQKNMAQWISRDFIISNYGNYFLILGSEKMPWAWLKDYSQSKMSCRSIIIKL